MKIKYEELRGALERFGLSPNEAKVYLTFYLTLLKLGSAMAGKIAKEAMIFSEIYNILDSQKTR